MFCSLFQIKFLISFSIFCLFFVVCVVCGVWCVWGFVSSFELFVEILFWYKEKGKGKNKLMSWEVKEQKKGCSKERTKKNKIRILGEKGVRKEMTWHYLIGPLFWNSKISFSGSKKLLFLLRGVTYLIDALSYQRGKKNIVLFNRDFL